MSKLHSLLLSAALISLSSHANAGGETGPLKGQDDDNNSSGGRSSVVAPASVPSPVGVSLEEDTEVVAPAHVASAASSAQLQLTMMEIQLALAEAEARKAEANARAAEAEAETERLRAASSAPTSEEASVKMSDPIAPPSIAPPSSDAIAEQQLSAEDAATLAAVGAMLNPTQAKGPLSNDPTKRLLQHLGLRKRR